MEAIKPPSVVYCVLILANVKPPTREIGCDSVQPRLTGTKPGIRFAINVGTEQEGEGMQLKKMLSWKRWRMDLDKGVAVTMAL